MSNTEFIDLIRNRTYHPDGTTLIGEQSLGDGLSAGALKSLYENNHKMLSSLRNVFAVEMLDEGRKPCLAIYRRPCPEFQKLCACMRRLHLKPFGLTDLFEDNVIAGMDGFDYRHRTCIAHSPDTCRMMISFLEKNRIHIFMGRIEMEYVTNNKRSSFRFSGERYEWPEVTSRGIDVRVFNKRGKLVEHRQFFVTDNHTFLGSATHE